MDEQLRLRLDRLISALEADRSDRRIPPAGSSGSRQVMSGDGSSFEIDMGKIGPSLDTISKKLSETFDAITDKVTSISNSITSFGNDIYQLYRKIDDARADFAKQTGLFQQAGPIYSSLSGKLRALGMDYSEVARHLAALVKDIPGFVDLTRAETTAIAMQSAKLSRLGVDTKVYADTFNFLTKTQGQSEKQTRKSIDGLMNFATALKRPPSVIMSDYTNAMSKLSLFGNTAEKVFKDSAMLSTKLGVSMEKVLSVMDNFNTFDEAAEAAGNLNIVLGQNVADTQELLFTQEPLERIKLIGKIFDKVKQQQGRSFNDFDIFMKRNVTKILNMDSDLVSKITKLKAGEYEEFARNIKKATDGTLKYEENVKSTLSVSERLEKLKDRIVGAFLPLMKYFEPILTSAAQIAEIFVNSIDKLGKQFPGFKGVLTGLVSAFTAFKALSFAGILGDDGIITKFFGAVTSFLPFGNILGKLALPAIGIGIANVATRSKDALKTMADTELVGGLTLRKMFGLSDDNIKLIQGKVDSIKNFIVDSFGNLLQTLGFEKKDRESIIDSIRKTFNEMYDTIAGVFGKIFKVAKSFMSGFSASMLAQKDSSDGPFTKLVISITEGIRFAIRELQKSFETENVTSTLGTAMTELINTFKKFGSTVMNLFIRNFGDATLNIASFFGKSDDKKGILDTLNGVPSWLTGNIDKFLETLKSVFGGIAEIFTASTTLSKSSTNVKDIKEHVQNVLSGISIGLSTARDIDGNSALNSLEKAQVALSSIKSLSNSMTEFSNSLKILGTDPGKMIRSVFDHFPAFEPISEIFISSIKGLASALALLNVQLMEFMPMRSVLQDIKVSPEASDNIHDLAKSVEEYSSALKKLEDLKTIQTNMENALKTLGETFTKLKLEVDAEAMGEVIGDKTANAIKRMHGG